MITARGYSKDPSLMPDGVCLTLPVIFFEDRKMSTDQFKKYFERYMQRSDAIWNFKLKNLPKMEVVWIYLIFDKQIQYRLNLVQYVRNTSMSFKDSIDGKVRHFPNQNWILFTGPAEKPPHEWPQKGFQGFRYCTKLF